MNWLKKHFERYRPRNAWDFCWRIAIEGTILSLLFAGVLSIIITEPEREFPDWGIGTFILVVVLIAPPAETVFLQALPIFVARRFKASFAACHIPEGIVTAVAGGLVGGFYFAFTYAHWRQKSIWTAFWVTALSHCIHNAICMALLVLLGD
jgi:hypothetical protein